MQIIAVKTNQGVFELDIDAAIAQGCGKYKSRPIKIGQLVVGDVFKYRASGTTTWKRSLWRVTSRASDGSFDAQNLSDDEEGRPPALIHFTERDNCEFTVLGLDNKWHTDW